MLHCNYKIMPIKKQTRKENYTIVSLNTAISILVIVMSVIEKENILSFTPQKKSILWKYCEKTGNVLVIGIKTEEAKKLLESGINNLKRYKLGVESGLLISLDEMGSFIWENMNGRNTIKDIVTLIFQKYDVDEESAEKDVLNFLDECEKLDIIFKDWRSM